MLAPRAILAELPSVIGEQHHDRLVGAAAVPSGGVSARKEARRSFFRRMTGMRSSRGSKDRGESGGGGSESGIGAPGEAAGSASAMQIWRPKAAQQAQITCRRKMLKTLSVLAVFSKAFVCLALAGRPGRPAWRARC